MIADFYRLIYLSQCLLSVTFKDHIIWSQSFLSLQKSLFIKLLELSVSLSALARILLINEITVALPNENSDRAIMDIAWSFSTIATLGWSLLRQKLA